MLFSMGAGQQQALFHDPFVNVRHVISLVAVLAAVGCVAAACGGSSSASSLSDGVIAQVNGEDITKAQLDTLLAQAKRSYKVQKQSFPSAGTTEYQQLRDQAVAYLAQRVEFEQKAKEMGINVTDAQVKNYLTTFKKKNFGGNEKKYQDALKAQGLTEADWQDIVRLRLLSQAIYNKVTNDVTVTDKDVKAYYQENISQYTKPESRPVRHILVTDKQTAEKVYNQLKAGGNFDALAKKYSTDTATKNKGGKLTAAKGQGLDPAFEMVAFGLKNDEISKPVHSQFGWHVIQALGSTTPAKVTPLKDVEKTIKQQLISNDKSSAATEWQTALTKEYEGKVKYATGYEPTPTQTQTTPTLPVQTSG
jgi:parvulin-like peptidyl-prolyl isomerase